MDCVKAINLTFCTLVAIWARAKGRSGTKAFFVGLFFSPMISFFVVALLKNKNAPTFLPDQGVYYTAHHQGPPTLPHQRPLTDPNPKH